MSEEIAVLMDMEIQCDASECDWSAKIDHKDLMDWLHVQCPECGEIVINDNDIAEHAKIVAVTEALNGIGRAFGFSPDEGEDTLQASLTISTESGSAQITDMSEPKIVKRKE